GGGGGARATRAQYRTDGSRGLSTAPAEPSWINGSTTGSGGASRAGAGDGAGEFSGSNLARWISGPSRSSARCQRSSSLGPLMCDPVPIADQPTDTSVPVARKGFNRAQEPRAGCSANPLSIVPT